MDFIVIGVQKAGPRRCSTTWPMNRASPSPTSRSPLLRRRDPGTGRRRLRRLSRPFPPPDGRPCGEATPIYAYWPNALARIAAYNPAMKLILMLRDPVERAWSHWRMEQSRGVETHHFSWCIREGRQRLFDAEPWGFHKEFSYMNAASTPTNSTRSCSFSLSSSSWSSGQDLRVTRPRSSRMSDLHRPAAGVGPCSVHPVGQDNGDASPIDAAFLREIYADDQSASKSCSEADR